jgi:ubiquinone biosynthesis protein UbiJ
VAEYLQEEGRDVPTRVEVDEFLEDVDRLRDDTERLEARLSRLESARQVPRRKAPSQG